MLDVAKKKLKNGIFRNNVTLINSDMAQINSLGDSSVDYIISTYNPLSFSPEPQKVVDEAYRLLKDNGTAALTTQGYHNALYSQINNYGATSVELQDLWENKKLAWNDYVPETWQLSKEDMETMFKKAGFKKLIVIHLSNRNSEDPSVERQGDTELFHVYPAVSTKGLDKTISISRVKTDEWIEDGYQCAREQLGPFLKEGELVASDETFLEGNTMKKFNYENFDYEKVFKEIEEEIHKPNILVCGATGVGKSSLIKDYFEMDDSNAPEIGDDGRAKTTSVHRYSPENSTVVLYDSAGYVFGESAKNYSRDIIGTIEDRKKNDPGDISNHIHEVWYCVSAI